MIGALLGFLSHLALAIWLGGMVFMTFVVAPALFRRLGPEDGGRATRAIFPVYYRLGASCGGVLVASLALGALLAPEPHARRGLEAILASAMLALTLYSWRVLSPRVELARLKTHRKDPTDPSTLERRYFRRLHGRSMRINLTVLLLGLITLMLHLLAR